MTKLEQETKRMALNPDPAFAKVASLKYLEGAFFTYWNESTDPHVMTFWREVAKEGLPFRRRDPVKEVLARGKIQNDVEFEAVTDAFGDDRFNEAKKRRFDSLLGAYGSAVLKNARGKRRRGKKR